MINVFYSADLQVITPEIYGFMESAVSPERRIKARNYIKMQDRILCCYAYLLLKYAVRKIWNMEDIPEIVTGKYGKPEFAEYKEYFFNYSHCSAGVCCALSSSETGADIQNTEKYTGMEYVMSLNEQNQILNSANPEREFTRLWAIKESYYKMLGVGLCGKMRETDFSALHSGVNRFRKNTVFVEEYPAFCLSVSAKGNHTVETEYIDPLECIRMTVDNFKNQGYY